MILPLRRPMVFFDIDETLVDQRSAEAAAGERFLEAFGRDLPHLTGVAEFCRIWRGLREKYASAFLHHGVSFHEQRLRRVRELFADTRPDLDNDELERRLAVYVQHYRRNWRLFDDARDALEAVREHPLGVISNGNSQQQRDKLRLTGIDRRFRLIVISEDIGWAKPDRNIFSAACRMAGLHPHECIHIGDRFEADALASRAIGMRGIWLNRHHEPTRDSDAIASLRELRDVLADRPAAGSTRPLAASPEALP
jgi:putative hydrolase of the HAD superfamily